MRYGVAHEKLHAIAPKAETRQALTNTAGANWRKGESEISLGVAGVHAPKCFYDYRSPDHCHLMRLRNVCA
jgi:F420-0:gamma-glutamyl ligase